LYFDGMAGDWDRRMVLDAAGVGRLEAALDELGLRPGDRVVDAGCGTGVLLPFLTKRIGPHGRVLAVDLAGAMAEAARLKHRRERRARWVAGDIAEVLEGTEPGSVDRIVCFSAFPHFADKPRVLRAFYRALREAGRFAIIHLKSSEELNRFHESLENTPVCGHVLPSAVQTAAMAREAGLAVLEAREQAGLYLVIGSR
jgi:demethylmenaquinone methyltransferase/2-methoxy-6-polyprenyl-1,4-benzoquinol methylase